VYDGLPEWGLKLGVASGGTPEALNVTVCVEPLFIETVIVKVTLDPCATRVCVGDTLKSKSKVDETGVILMSTEVVPFWFILFQA
jgi:hypothetical protein